MNVHYLNKTASADVLYDAIDDARRFWKKEAPTLWDVCDCIGNEAARDAVEDLIELFCHSEPAPETIITRLQEIVCMLINVPFAVIDKLDEGSRLNGAAGNAIRFYGPRLTDLNARIFRATKGVAGSNMPT